jgi:carboxypeptidase family protein/TonB-dependent receptor-like protein
MSKRPSVSLLWPLLVLFASASNGFAQGAATLFGTVRDTSGAPVALARLSSSGILAISDTAGRFRLRGLPDGAAIVAVRRLGFAPRDTAMQLEPGRTDSLLVVLTVLPLDLPGVTTEAETRARLFLPEFYRHREGAGGGHFFDRKQLDSSRTNRLSDVLRHVPGMRITSDRVIPGRTAVRTGRSSGARDCPPDFWIDGVRATGFTVDEIPLDDIEAIEVYKGPAALPPEYNSRFGNPACGTIVLWTRIPD